MLIEIGEGTFKSIVTLTNVTKGYDVSGRTRLDYMKPHNGKLEATFHTIDLSYDDTVRALREAAQTGSIPDFTKQNIENLRTPKVSADDAKGGPTKKTKTSFNSSK